MHSLNQAPCEDGDPCTAGEKCAAGICEGGIVDDCDDEDVCTDDVCHEQQGCLNTPILDDCDDGNPCTDDTCDPEDGCVSMPIEGDCEGGQCVDGICEPVCVPACAGKECGADGCDGTCGTCDDGFNCANGACVEAGNQECNDGNDILWDGCTKGKISEFRVNTFTPGQQTFPDVAGLSNGRHVIVWSSYDQDGSDYGVYGQLHNADGTFLGSEFQLNTFTTNAQYLPRVAALQDGEFIVAWQTVGQYDGWDIYARRYAADGTPLGGEALLNNTTSSTQDQPSLSGRNDGSYVASWRGYPDGGGYGIFTRPFSADNTPIVNDINTVTEVKYNQYRPDVATTATGSIVVWESNGQDNNGYGIYGQLFTLGGNKSGEEFRVNTYTPSHQRFARVATHSDGSFAAVWQSDNEDGSGSGVYCQRFGPAAEKKGNPFRVNTYIVSNQEDPDLAGWADGRFVVVWYSYNQDGENGGIYGQRFNSDGTPAGSEFQVNSYTAYDQLYPAVSTIPGEGFVVTWNSQAQDDSVSGVFAQRYDAVGNKLYH